MPGPLLRPRSPPSFASGSIATSGCRENRPQFPSRPPVNREPPRPARFSPYRGRLATRGELKRG
jgi:hypothetical protein